MKQALVLVSLIAASSATADSPMRPRTVDGHQHFFDVGGVLVATKPIPTGDRTDMVKVSGLGSFTSAGRCIYPREWEAAEGPGGSR